jgi:protein phosphatase
MKLNTFAQTDIGLKRKINQDAFLKDDDLALYIVADGMGGHRGGEVASRLCVEGIQGYCRDNRNSAARDLLDKGINISCEEIYRQATQNPDLAGMGTTVAALLFQGDAVYVGQVGDSRAYLISHDGIWQITEDHSLLNEEIRAGRLDAAQVATYQFRNVITRSVGYESHVMVDIYRRRPKIGELYFLCTDGLSGLVEMREIYDELRKYGPEAGLKNLVNMANQRGGDDNITALVCQIAGLD